MTAPSYTEIKGLLKKCQENKLIMEKTFPEKISYTINGHADEMGCPPEFLAVPLLTCVGSMMRMAVIKKDERYVVPPIINAVVVARKGEGKSPALNVLTDPIQRMEEELSQTQPTQLMVDDITFEGLHSTMMKNGNCALGIYDEIRTFHQSLDVYKKSSTEKTTLLKLYNGGPWKKKHKERRFPTDETDKIPTNR